MRDIPKKYRKPGIKWYYKAKQEYVGKLNTWYSMLSDPECDHEIISNDFINGALQCLVGLERMRNEGYFVETMNDFEYDMIAYFTDLIKEYERKVDDASQLRSLCKTQAEQEAMDVEVLKYQNFLGKFYRELEHYKYVEELNSINKQLEEISRGKC